MPGTPPPDRGGAADCDWAGAFAVGTAVVEGDEVAAIVTGPPAIDGPAWAAAVVTKDEAAESLPPAASVARVKGTDLEDRAGIGVSACGAILAGPLGTETDDSS